MEDTFPALRQLHRKLLLAVALHPDAQKCASLLTPHIPDAALASQGAVENVSSTWSPREVTVLQLSLIQMLIAKAESPRTEPSARCQYTQVARLLQQAGVEVTIVRADVVAQNCDRTGKG
ncbi:hypothetical protein FKM82_025313, partial [Ascaphus truei]